MLSTNGKASLAVLGILVGASALGILPIGQFFWRTAPAPRIEPLVKPVPPLVEPLPPVVLVKPPVGPVVVVNTASPGRGLVRAGPITVEGVLGQSKLVYGQDGTVYVDVKVTGDEAKGDSERRPVDLALVLDVSGSMSGENKITLMREACRRLAPQLTSGDRVAVIAFSTDARVLFPLQSLEGNLQPEPAAHSKWPRAVDGYQRAIDALVPTASTNISAGLEAGAAELKRAGRPGAARRLLLLTDGIANVGNCTFEGLVGLTRKLGNEGFSVSTVGLGLDYQATLLSAMAESGGGNFHYVENAARIAGVFDAEFKGLRSLVAKGLRVTLTPQEGTEIAEIIEWSAERNGSTTWTINVGDIESARQTKIVARLRVPTGKDVTAENVLSVGFRAEDARTGETLAPSPMTLGVSLTKSQDEAHASIDTSIKGDLAAACDAADLEGAHKAAESGDKKEFGARMGALRSRGQTDLRYKGADGKDAVMSLEEYEKRAFDRDASKRQDAQNLCKSAAGQSGK